MGALHTDELKIAAAWSDAEPLQEELKGFLRKVSGRGEGDLQCPHGCSRRLGAGGRDRAVVGDVRRNEHRAVSARVISARSRCPSIYPSWTDRFCGFGRSMQSRG